MTLVTGKIGRMSATDIHEERLETLMKQAVTGSAPAALTAVHTGFISYPPQLPIL